VQQVAGQMYQEHPSDDQTGFGSNTKHSQISPSSLLKNLEMESFRILAGRC
jgi:hypothetical protein